MAHRANRLIVEELVRQGWFRNPRRVNGLSDNWWLLENGQQRDVLAYVVRFAASSERGEPTKIPNERTALPKLAERQKRHGLSAGPYLVLAEVSHSGLEPEILSLRVWRLYAQHLSGAKQVPVEELGKPKFAW